MSITLDRLDERLEELLLAQCNEVQVRVLDIRKQPKGFEWRTGVLEDGYIVNVPITWPVIMLCHLGYFEVRGFDLHAVIEVSPKGIAYPGDQIQATNPIPVMGFEI